jgi:heat shock protein HslJ
MMGNYTASGESGLSFDQLGSTKRACLPNGPEGRLIKGLSETERYRLDGSELVLIGSEHTELLRFRKAD